jgi:threonyl-tRNA synthetase
MKVPYIVIVGEKEKESNSLSIREYRTKDQYEISVDEFIEKCLQEYRNRS